MNDLLKLMGQRIRDRRTFLKMSQTELANRTGYSSRSSINKVEKGLVDIPQSKIKLIADVLMTTPACLTGWDEQADQSSLLSGARPIKLKRFPVLGNVACGEPTFAEEERGTYLDAAADINADFCLIASGDSMINARIFDGDVLFVKKQEMVDDGEIAVILIGDEATVKRVYYDRENNVITLVPENPTHKPMRFEGKKLDEIAILGKVVAGQYTVR